MLHRKILYLLIVLLATTGCQIHSPQKSKNTTLQDSSQKNVFIAAEAQTKQKSSKNDPKSIPAIRDFVSIEPEKDTINPYLFGFNTANYFTYQEPIEESDTLLQKISPKILRFPGGTIANFYHSSGPNYGFKQSTLDMAQNPPKMDTTIKPTGRNYILDFIELSNRINLNQTIYVANIIDADPKEIVENLQTLQDNNIKIISIEIGNELYSLNYENFLDIQTYIQKSEALTKIIRAKFPTIRIGVVAAPFVQKPLKYPERFARFDSWNRALAQKKFYDAIIVHDYLIMNKFETKKDTTNPNNVIKYGRKHIEITLPEEVKTLQKIYGDDIEIWITEWNIHSSTKYRNTMFHALYGAHYWLNLSTNPILTNVSIAVYHNLLAKSDMFTLFNKQKNKSLFTTNNHFHSTKMLSKLFDGKHSFIQKYVKNQNIFFYEFQDNRTKTTFILNWSGQAYPINNIFFEVSHIETLGAEKIDQAATIQYQTIAPKEYTDFHIQPFSITKVTHQ